MVKQIVEESSFELGCCDDGNYISQTQREAMVTLFQEEGNFLLLFEYTVTSPPE